MDRSGSWPVRNLLVLPSIRKTTCEQKTPFRFVSFLWRPGAYRVEDQGLKHVAEDSSFDKKSLPRTTAFSSPPLTARDGGQGRVLWIRSHQSLWPKTVREEQKRTGLQGRIGKFSTKKCNQTDTKNNQAWWRRH